MENIYKPVGPNISNTAIFIGYQFQKNPSNACQEHDWNFCAYLQETAGQNKEKKYHHRTEKCIQVPTQYNLYHNGGDKNCRYLLEKYNRQIQMNLNKGGLLSQDLYQFEWMKGPISLGSSWVSWQLSSKKGLSLNSPCVFLLRYAEDAAMLFFCKAVIIYLLLVHVCASFKNKQQRGCKVYLQLPTQLENSIKKTQKSIT